MAHDVGGATFLLRDWLMTADPDPDGSGRSTGQDERADSLEEIIEALTALGNYLSVAHHMISVEGSCKQSQVLGTALEKAVEQYERAISALRNLCNS